MQLFVATKAVIEYNNKVLIMRESGHYADGTKAGLYDFPGGRIEPHETLLQALQREVAEETSLYVTEGKFFHVFENFLSIQGVETHIVRLYFACRAPGDAVELSDDHDDYQWIDPREHAQYPLIDNEHATLEKYLSRVQ